MSSHGNLIRTDENKKLKKQKRAGNFDIRRWKENRAWLEHMDGGRPTGMSCSLCQKYEKKNVLEEMCGIRLLAKDCDWRV